MSERPHNQKMALRTRTLAALKNISQKKRQSDSQKLCTFLEQQSFFQQARSVLFFAPLPDEVDIWPLLEKTVAGNKRVALPCFDAEKQVYAPRRINDLSVEIISGQFGIREPAIGCVSIPLADLDLVLVPGVAFDRHGRRLGRGKGFYDRLLQGFEGKKAAIAFDEQIVHDVPAEATDVRMDFIVTPTRCLEITK